jgi:Rtf2 RING-finger
MGGDGGTNAVQRAYLRGAGAASTTGDSANSSALPDKRVAEEEAKRAMRYCHISDQPLDFEAPSSIATCRLGRLYNKEALIDALLQRKQSATSTQPIATERGGQLGAHIRGLKDIYGVCFQTIRDEKDKPVPVCPITGRELNGLLVAYALIPSPPDQVNVVSEYALKHLSETEILQEYGAIMKIRLLPPTSMLEELQNALELERRNEKKKRKRIEQDES